MTGQAVIIRGDARQLPLADASVDLIVTSPPYFALRSYQDGGQHYDGQIGSEGTPAEWLEALWECTREMMRCLKPEGSLFLNLGDKYAGAGGGGVGSSDGYLGRAGRPARFDVGIPTKSLMGLPWRYAIGCIDQLGLILRAEIIWSKPNGLPESVTDRVRRSHETWFHFVRRLRYYSAVDEIREAHALKTLTHKGGGQAYGNDRNPDNQWGNPNGHARTPDPLGKLPGSVWSIPSEPLQVPEHLGVDHFAAFPTEWPRRLILGWSPPGICTACGQGRRPVAEGEYRQHRPSGGKTSRIERGNKIHDGGAGQWGTFGTNLRRDVEITGYVCACPEPTASTHPSVILDPFGGTGTVALVAKTLGRIGVSVDLSGDYCRLAQWRTSDPGEHARAMRVPKPPAQVDNQLGLFEDVS